MGETLQVAQLAVSVVSLGVLFVLVAAMVPAGGAPGGKDIWKGIGIFFGVLALVLAGTSVYDRYIRNSPCPVCDKTVERGRRQCPHCGTRLRWK